MSKFIDFVASRRWIAWSVLLLLTLPAIYGVSRLKLSDQPRLLLGDDAKARRFQELSEAFGLDPLRATVVVQADDIFSRESLADFRRLVSDLGETQGVTHTNSLFSIPKFERPEWLVDRPVLGWIASLLPRSVIPPPDAPPATLAKFRREALQHPLVQGLLLSDDGRTTVVMVDLQHPEESGENLQAVVERLQKVGIRASRPDEIWHIDMTQIRLLDGTRAYLHAVIDNFSRRLLAWKVAETFDPAVTAQLLLIASKGIDGMPTMLADGGVENFNGAVDELVDAGVLKRVLARTDVTFSNSLIESWWRILKHQWLYLNTLDSVEMVRKLVTFYIQEHYSRLPHSAFQGQTPDEIYFQTGKKIPKQLAAARQQARKSRAEANRQSACSACEPATVDLN